jgi:hypothetical protein
LRNTGSQIPNANIQISTKPQTQNLKPQRAGFCHLDFRFLNLFGFWFLKFVIYVAGSALVIAV